jgi:hypothetical protein
MTLYEALKKHYGACSKGGVRVALARDAEHNCDADRYEAAAIDADGKHYSVYWAIANPDAESDEYACDWGNPNEITPLETIDDTPIRIYRLGESMYDSDYGYVLITLSDGKADYCRRYRGRDYALADLVRDVRAIRAGDIPAESSNYKEAIGLTPDEIYTRLTQGGSVIELTA